MNRNTKILLLKKYKEVLNYLKEFEIMEEFNTNDKGKVLVLTKPFRGKQLKVC